MRSPRTPFEPVATRRVGPGVEFGALAIPIRIVCVSGNYPERVELSGARARLRFSSLRARPNTTGDSFDRDDRLLRIDDHDRRARACDDDEVDADVRDVTHKNYNYVERRFHPIPGLAPHAFVTSAIRLKARACPPATRRRDAEGVRPD